MALTRILIAVKTYPTLSDKYGELVCTAGFLEDGTWIRIYPVPFRKLTLDDQYQKYDWIDIDLEKNTSDFRPESYSPKSLEKGFDFIENIDTKDNWRHRKDIVLKNVYTNMTELIALAKDKTKCVSLAVLKPKEILSFKIEDTEREWNQNKLDKIKAKEQQLNLFKPQGKSSEIVNKLPYKFSYTFISEDDVERTLMIEDWEIGALYWNCLKNHEGDEEKACADVKKKYFDDFAKTKDLYLFLGTTREFHLIAPNPFVIIGVFYPKKVTQTSLF